MPTSQIGIAVDEDYLKAMTGIVLPNYADFRMRALARILTDVLRAHQQGKSSAEKLEDGMAWINYVYKTGYESGQYDSQLQFREKIERVFGL